MTVDVICCVCGVKYGEKDGFATSAPTHGYCPTCFDVWMKQNEKPLFRSIHDGQI